MIVAFCRRTFSQNLVYVYTFVFDIAERFIRLFFIFLKNMLSVLLQIMNLSYIVTLYMQYDVV